MMNITNYLAKSLLNNGITTIFGIPSYTFMNGLYEFHKLGFKMHLNSHEQNAAHAAEGYFYATDKTAVLSVAMGPGVTNAITGITNAYVENVPMLILIPTAYSSKIGQNEYHSNSGIGNNIDETQLLKSCTKSIYRITDNSHAKSHIDNAIRDLTSGRKGPVVISIPPELQKVEIKAGISSKAVIHTNQTISSNTISEIKNLWDNSRSPIFMLGKEVRDIKKNKLTKLLKNNSPFFTSYGAKGYAPKLRNNIGTVWYCNAKHIESAVRDSDLIIAIGEDFTHFTARAIHTEIAGTKLIHFHSEIEELGRVFPNCLKINSDSESATDVMSKLEKKSWNLPLSDISIAYTDTQRYIRNLNQYLPNDSVFFADVGNAGYLAITELELSTQQDFYTSGKFGSCGWSIASAIGYSMAANKPTFSIIGDLSLNMNLQELANINKFKAHSNFILFNNSSPQNIAQDQIDELGEEFHTNTPEIDWKHIAAGYGLKYLLIDSTDSLSQIKELDYVNHSHIIEIVIDSSERPLDR